ncbi:peptidase domain-containing ABC transporter [Luteibacter jiangsuensis]|uniref:Peptidase domain-containing ABC transporter n=1 Tax=Luteibacter jiangsuensis TaxID=637577 RepID=A0ABX0Q9K4_9GAMM|nr:peptidase domain-containing ABC transporter [Luteibacter jiangsuensis]
MKANKEYLSTPWTLANRLGVAKRTPVIRQAEQAECGLACIAMILGHHGHHVSLRDLRERAELSSRGASLNDLMGIAGERGLRCRPLRLEMGELEQLHTPCILHWRLDHFVVLLKVSRKHAIIHDPAAGRRRLPLSEVSRFFTGIAMEAVPGNQFASLKIEPAIRLRTMFRLLNGYASSLGSILGFSLALEVLALLMPQLVQIVVDQVLANGDYDLLTLVGISFILLTLITSAISACRSWSVAWLRAHGGMRWTGVLFDRLLRLQQGYFERRHVGDVVSRVDAIHGIQQAVTGQLVGALMDGMIGVATLVLLILYSPPLAAVVCCGTLLYAVIRLSIYRRLREVSIDQIEATASQRTDLVECIRGVRTIRLNNKTSIRSALHANKTASVQTQQFRSDKLGILFEATSSTLSGSQRVIILWAGASFAMRGQMTAGMLMALSAYADQFAHRANALIDYLIQLRLLKIQGERVADVILSPEEPNMVGSYQGPEHAPSLRFDNISYRYSGNSPWILRNASLSIEPGECVAIVGASGAGKTTALRLLLGLIDPCEGSVRVGGIDLAHLGKSSFRERTGVVLQDDHLFSGTIADNICFFDASAAMNDIYAAASLARIHDDICNMPMGYRTLVGDMGSVLSGGQKQRIVLARALYRKPSVLVLDEATSHLDLITESEVAAHLKELKMTRITIAHRPETVRAADRVFSLVDGQFVELRPVQSS